MNIVKLVISFCDHCVLLCNDVQNVWDSFFFFLNRPPWTRGPAERLQEGAHWFRRWSSRCWSVSRSIDS